MNLTLAVKNKATDIEGTWAVPSSNDKQERCDMNQDVIHIVGACQNNLKNISIDIPKHKWVTFTGVSGSGKSTLVFDLIYARAEKEFLESLSA